VAGDRHGDGLARPGAKEVRDGGEQVECSRGSAFFLVGVDTIKSTIYDRIARGRALRLSDTLERVGQREEVGRYMRGTAGGPLRTKAGGAGSRRSIAWSMPARPSTSSPFRDARENARRQVIHEPTTPTEVRSPRVSVGS
jgi:hypothetical protein